MANKVKRDFFDKEDNHKPYRTGDSFEGNDKRVSFLVDKGFLHPAPKEEKKSPKNKTKK